MYVLYIINILFINLYINLPLRDNYIFASFFLALLFLNPRFAQSNA